MPAMPSPDHIIGELPNAGRKEFWSLFFMQLKHHFMNIWWGRVALRYLCIKLG